MSERLTERVGDGIRYDNGEYTVTCYPKNDNLRPVDKLAAKLCEFEEKIENGTLIELPCKVGDTVYVIEPLWFGIWGDDEHKCRKCWYFYEGGMGDPPGCALEDDCCYHIVETKADLRHIADWIIPSMFVGEIAWGKTAFLTREEAEKALAERSKQ